jgi:hypothetical protein
MARRRAAAWSKNTEPMKHIPRKRFGQNFLTDDVVLHDIISSIAPAADDAMVEIGPGLAAMTGRCWTPAPPARGGTGPRPGRAPEKPSAPSA